MSVSTLPPARLSLLLLFLASGAILLGALGFQYLGDLKPCELCLWQRYPHDAVLIVAGAAALFAPRPAQPWLLALVALILLAGAGVAAFHVGVEQKWWHGLASCSGQVDMSKLDPQALRRMLEAGPPVRCGEVAWSLFGISMAGYNFLVSVALALFAAWSALRVARRPA